MNRSSGKEEFRSDAAAPSGMVADFRVLARDVLELLADRVGLRLWLVTRVVDDGQLVLVSSYSPQTGYDVPAGAVLSWPASLCFQMVAGPGPRLVPRVADVPPYAAAAAALPAPVAAYVGMPLHRPDGSLFGTLCGFDPEPQPPDLLDAEPLVRLQARLLATVLAHELQAEQQARRAEQAEAQASVDALTGLANRRAWDRLLAREEARCRRYGSPACVLMVDLDGLKRVNDTQGHAAGDELLRQAAQVLAMSARRGDLVARLGGDEFAVLAVETDAAQGARQAERLQVALDDAGVAAAVGLGVRPPASSLVQAWQQADRAMYAAKHRSSSRSRDARDDDGQERG